MADWARAELDAFDVSGPLAFDLIMSPEAAATKNLTADPVAGHADAIIVPDIVSGNALFKAFVYLTGGCAAGIVTGCQSADPADIARGPTCSPHRLCGLGRHQLRVAKVILVLNAGSSSLKIEVFDEALRSAISGRVTNLGSAGIAVGRSHKRGRGAGPCASA